MFNIWKHQYPDPGTETMTGSISFIFRTKAFTDKKFQELDKIAEDVNNINQNRREKHLKIIK